MHLRAEGHVPRPLDGGFGECAYGDGRRRIHRFGRMDRASSEGWESRGVGSRSVERRHAAMGTEMTFTRRWFILALIGVVPLLLSGVAPGTATTTLIWCTGLLVASLADWFAMPRAADLEIERHVGERLSLAAPNLVEIVARLLRERPIRVTVHEEPPDGVAHDWQDTAIHLLPGKRPTIEYHVTPHARGDYRFGDLWLRLDGPLGLVRATRIVPAECPVRVYPNLREIAKYDMATRRGRLVQVGIRSTRLVGAGLDFESLRDYMPDDEYRRIDWKASARRGKLISRQYEVERSQNVLLLIDAGRTMLADIDGIAKMDYAVNAALLLAYAATSAGDRVGLLTFADTVQTWIAPNRGKAQVYRIAEALYNATARRVEPDYRSAIAHLSSRWRRRSLVIAFTDLWDPDSSRQAISEIAALQPRHLVACATLLDPARPGSYMRPDRDLDRPLRARRRAAGAR